MSLQAIKFEASPEPRLLILNQLTIPHELEYLEIDSIAPLDEDAELARFSGYDAIKGMYTRGAPAIMLVGCFSICIELSRVLKSESEASKFGYDTQSLDKFKHRLLERIDHLIESRPTAVNLSNGCNLLKKLISEYPSTGNVTSLYHLILENCQIFYNEDLQYNISIGENGLQYIIDSLKESNFKGPFSVMTICNTGSLATSNHGTALGIIRHLNKYLSKSSSEHEFYFDHAYACETRPYNQGSRLTAFELLYESIPSTLITDNMVSFLIDNLNNPENHVNQSIDLKSTAPLRFIIVGADRIVQNGDLANKIGTFQLSLISSIYNDVKFIGAAPTTTIDHQTKSGEDIKIEERPHDELTIVSGALVDSKGQFIKSNENAIQLAKVRTAPVGINVWNPSFDVTPHKNIDCIVTEAEYVTKDSNGDFHL